LFLLLQEIDDLLTGALTPDDEEAVEEELEKIIQAEMPEEASDVVLPTMPDVPAEPGSHCCFLFMCHSTVLKLLCIWLQEAVTFWCTVVIACSLICTEKLNITVK
jgi:hypothetical protein